jgi:hypothetical protein
MEPRISFVVAARNDNYGVNFLHRMQVFIDVLLASLRKYKVIAELIIVEWNPPEDTPQLEEALTWPEHLTPVTVRIIEVPKSIHKSLPNSDRMPMFEYSAKNAGIRRARGEYVLVTNPDLLFSEELIAYLGAGKLSHSCFYRIDRYDFRGSVPIGTDARVALHFAMRNIFQVNIREDSKGVSCIRISRLARWYYLRSGKWPGSHKGYVKGQGSEPLISLNDDNGAYGGNYTNASGDFLLASSESWRRIKGFPEFTETFTHLDSYACHQLRASGLEQTLFLPPCMILHTEHGRGEQKFRPKVSEDKWQNDLRMIRSGLLGPTINSDAWGLAGEVLDETILSDERCSK